MNKIETQKEYDVRIRGVLEESRKKVNELERTSRIFAREEEYQRERLFLKILSENKPAETIVRSHKGC